jgi:hypothetical protein
LLLPHDVAEASICLSGGRGDSDDQKPVWTFVPVGVLGIVVKVEVSVRKKFFGLGLAGFF